MKIAIVDFETTGLDPYDNAEICEIGMVVFDSVTGVKLDVIEIRVKPEYPWLGSDEAMKVNGYNDADWANAMDLKRALRILLDKGKGCVFASWNVAFDWTFLSWALRETKLENTFQQRKLDVLSMAWQYIHSKNPDFVPRPFSLKNACEHFGIEPEPELHRALGGAMCAYQIYKKIQNL